MNRELKRNIVQMTEDDYKKLIAEQLSKDLEQEVTVKQVEIAINNKDTTAGEWWAKIVDAGERAKNYKAGTKPIPKPPHKQHL